MSKFTDIETTIQRLLAKAESTTPEEAEALTERAERLMVRHGIDAAIIAAKRGAGEREKIITTTIPFTGSYAYGLMLMGHQVVQAFGTMQTYKVGTGTRVNLKIMGFESDVAQAKLLVESLHLQAIVAMRAWWKRERSEYQWHAESVKQRVRRQFIISFGAGAAERIKAATTETLAEQEPGNALVLVDRKALVEERMREEHPDLRRGRAYRSGGNAAHTAGRAAGRNANTGGTALGNRARALV